MPPNRVDEWTMAHKPILVYVTAIVKGLVDQILADGSTHEHPTGIGVDEPTGQYCEGRRQQHEGEQRAPWEEDDAEFTSRIDGHDVVREILMMLASMAIVDCPQRPNVNEAMHHILVNPPFEKIRQNENRNDQQPFPRCMVHPTDEVRDRRDADAVHHADVDDTVVERVYLGLIFLPESTLFLGH